jgi:hypothetical protein
MKEKCPVQVPVCSLPLGPLLGELPGLHLLVEGGEDLLHAAAALTQQECLRLLETRNINISRRAKLTHKSRKNLEISCFEVMDVLF